MRIKTVLFLSLSTVPLFIDRLLHNHSAYAKHSAWVYSIESSFKADSIKFELRTRCERTANPLMK